MSEAAALLTPFVELPGVTAERGVCFDCHAWGWADEGRKLPLSGGGCAEDGRRMPGANGLTCMMLRTRFGQL